MKSTHENHFLEKLVIAYMDKHERQIYTWTLTELLFKCAALGKIIISSNFTFCMFNGDNKT